MKLTPEKIATVTVLAVTGLTVILSMAMRLSIRVAESESTAHEAVAAARDVEERLSDVKSTISDLSDTSDDHEARLENIESQQSRRSW